MKLTILPSARDDLARGFDFYEAQGEGLGSYFLESLFSDIDSLKLYAGIHRKVFGFHRSLSKRFPMQSTTPWNLRLRLLVAYLIVAATRRGSVND